jgi:AcrR family transcriptional regulator
MSKRQVRENATAARRETILKAALDCFVTLGFQATTIDEIRARAQASTGSIYHHFTSKEQLAGELYIAGLRDYQHGLVETLQRARQAEAGIKGIVDYHLQWIGREPDWARYLFFMRAGEFAPAVQETIQQMNRELFRELLAWLKPQIAARVIVELPADLYAAILIGPSQEFARHWLASRIQTDMKRARKLLAEAAWRSLRANP